MYLLCMRRWKIRYYMAVSKSTPEMAPQHTAFSLPPQSRARPLLRICGMNIILQREAVRRRTGGQGRRRQRRLQRWIGNVGKNKRRPRRANNPAAGRTRTGRSRVGHRWGPIDGHSVYCHLRRGADFQGAPAQGRRRCSRRGGRWPPRLNSGEPGRHRLLLLLWRLIGFRGRGWEPGTGAAGGGASRAGRWYRPALAGPGRGHPPPCRGRRRRRRSNLRCSSSNHDGTALNESCGGGQLGSAGCERPVDPSPGLLDAGRPQRWGLHLQRTATEEGRQRRPLHTFPVLEERLERLLRLVVVEKDDKKQEPGGDERGKDDDHHAGGIVPCCRVRLPVPVGSGCRLFGWRQRSDLIGRVGSAVVGGAVGVGDGHVGAGAKFLLWTAPDGLCSVLAHTWI